MYVCIHITTYHGWRMVWLRHLARIVAPDTEILVTFRIIWRNYMTRVFVGILDACKSVCVCGRLCVCEKEREKIYACVHVRVWVGVRVCIGGWARKSTCCQFFFFCACRVPRNPHVTHMWMSHVTRVNESCHTREWSHVTHVNESCHAYGRVMSRMDESCHTCVWVMSQRWMRHVTHMNEACHTYEEVVPNSRERHPCQHPTYSQINTHTPLLLYMYIWGGYD